MASGNEICRMDAVTLARLIRSRDLSPVEVTDAVLARMERLEPLLHAFCTPTPDIARDAAKQIEKRIMAGEDVGPLAGIPWGCKDLICTAGIKTVSGSHAYEDFVPDEDDVVVERMRDAGAVILGKTNVPEFGYSGVGHNPVFDTTRNPWRTELTPGGSSAGSGAAVASGMGPFTIGSDGGGSVRIPSSFSGLYGLKPSMGRVPLYPGVKDERYPGVSSWEALEHIGPMSRTVADSALMLSVIAGPDDRDNRSLPQQQGFDWMTSLKGDLKGLRVAYSPDWGYAAVDKRVHPVEGQETIAVEEAQRRNSRLVPIQPVQRRKAKPLDGVQITPSGKIWPVAPRGSDLSQSTSSSASLRYRCGNSAPPREGSHFSAGPSRSDSNATSTRLLSVPNHLAAVSDTWAAVEKWI